MKKAPEAFRTISEVSDLLDTPAHVLRFWESKFYQIRPVKRAGGRRYYRPDDVSLIGGIKILLQDQGLTIRGAQRVLHEQGVRHVASLCPPLAELGSGEDGYQDDEALEAANAMPARDAGHDIDDAEIVGAEPTESRDAAEAAPLEVASGPVGNDDSRDSKGLDPLDPVAAAPEPEPEPGFMDEDIATSGTDDDAVLVPQSSDEAEPEDTEAIPEPVMTAPADTSDGTSDAVDVVAAQDSPLSPELSQTGSEAQDDTQDDTEDLLAAVARTMEAVSGVAAQTEAIDATNDETLPDHPAPRLAPALRAMRRGSLGAERAEQGTILIRRIEALLERMSAAAGAGRW